MSSVNKDAYNVHVGGVGRTAWPMWLTSLIVFSLLLVINSYNGYFHHFLLTEENWQNANICEYECCTVVGIYLLICWFIFISSTRLPSNLTQTTGECVHLVRCGHFRSRVKDGSHAHAARTLRRSIFYRTGVIANRSITLRELAFFYLFCFCNLDLDPITFIIDPDVYPLKMYRMGKNKLPISRLLKVIVLQTDIQPDGHTREQTHAALRVVKSSNAMTTQATRCSAIAERPRCRVRYSFRQK